MGHVTGCHSCGWSAGLQLWVPPWLKGHNFRFLCCYCPPSIPWGATVAEIPELCPLPSLMLLVLWAWPQWLKVWDHRHPLSLSSVSSSLHTFRCTDVLNSFVWCVAQCHLCWHECFTGCRLTCRDQESVSSCHDTEVTPLLWFFFFYKYSNLCEGAMSLVIADK